MHTSAREAAARTLVVLFDGECVLCNRFVAFLVRHDEARRLRFGAIRSEAGRALLAARGFDPESLETIVVLAGERTLTRSDAALAIVRVLPAPWRGLTVLGMLPRPLRDALYRIVARHRHAWFGRTDGCPVPEPAVRDRFLD